MPMHRIPLFLLLASMALAQVAPTGALVGEVTDSSGAVIPNAAVVLVNTGTQARKQTTTGPGGRFAFQLLPVGTYLVKATANGFSSYEQTGIRVDVDSSPSVSIVLRVGAMSEQVTIASDAAMVATESGTLSQVVRERYIEDLPLDGRNAASLVFMVPGTVTGVGTTTAGY